MVDWLHCLGPVVRQHTMVGAHGQEVKDRQQEQGFYDTL
jgi:hypothetical protein